jgi:protein-L-isoaspartate(D-aspartate) O-methyltransferase
MTLPHPDYELARNLMVDGQLRPNQVWDPRILDAMRTLKRETFVPTELAPLAYIDDHLDLGGGRFLMRPLTLARLLQLAAPRPGESVLVVGAGTGYGAAVLAACGAQVTALEERDDLARIAREACREAAPTVSFVSGPLAEGCPARAPFDLIVIEGAVRALPPKIEPQLAASGRLATIIAPEGGASYAALAEHSLGGLRARPEFDANAPLLPELRPAPAFTF